MLRLPGAPILLAAFALATVGGCGDGDQGGDGGGGGGGASGSTGSAQGGTDAGAAGIPALAGSAGIAGQGHGEEAGQGGQGGAAGQAGSTSWTEEELVALCDKLCAAQAGLTCLDVVSCKASCRGLAASDCPSEYIATLRCSATLGSEIWRCDDQATVPMLAEGTPCEALNCEYVTCVDATVDKPPEMVTLYPWYQSRCYP